MLKVHKLTISVQKNRDFDAELRKGLENYMKVKFAGASSAEKEDLEYSLLVVPIANNTLEETYQMRLAI
ncbi:hypothetical protein [uncultured Nostoc sp.]|uniref:hypothetical protein n=1 Tax=uncultured Nostoc sp. TaxID=340711 RepID=UPI0035CB4DA0